MTVSDCQELHMEQTNVGSMSPHIDSNDSMITKDDNDSNNTNINTNTNTVEKQKMEEKTNNMNINIKTKKTAWDEIMSEIRGKKNMGNCKSNIINENVAIAIIECDDQSKTITNPTIATNVTNATNATTDPTNAGSNTTKLETTNHMTVECNATTQPSFHS